MSTEIQILQKTQLTPPKTGDFLADSIDDFLLIKSPALQPKSLKTYRESLNYLIQYFGAERITETIGTAELAEFFRWIPRTPSGVYMVWQTSKFFFTWFYLWDPYKNPMLLLHMTRPKRDPIKGITPDEVEKILKKTSGPNAARDKALISVLYASGLRAAEFCGLRLDDINLRTGVISVRSENAKGRKFRQVAITGKALQLLNRWVKKLSDREPTAPIWQTRTGAPLKEDGIREIVNRCCAAAGLEAYSFHDFRRGSALALSRAGADIKTISHFLGHADIKTTERYIKLDETDAVRTAVLFDPLK